MAPTMDMGAAAGQQGAAEPPRSPFGERTYEALILLLAQPPEKTIAALSADCGALFISPLFISAVPRALRVNSCTPWTRC
jgi:hypothetical protein